MLEKLGDRLKRARQEAGLKQIYVAKQVGIGRCTIGACEKGVFVPTSYTLRDLCVLYNVSADWLIFGEPYAPLPTIANLNLQDNLIAKLPPEIKSLCAIGKYLGVGAKTAKRVLGGESPTQIRLLVKMAEKLNTTCDYLLFGVEATEGAPAAEKLPKPGEVWEHYKGGIYQVLHVANAWAEDGEKFPLTIVYRNVATKMLWVRPWVEFKEKFVFKGWKKIC